ncbi:hypothetical protein [Peribacillus glennii]|uniref:hypothetical protein n=1 Tax=Peribacillus glennii TaxID=2303991 RepID=UPI00115F32BA|nr:hypothetical protein [Peribacillus glennii]
MRSQLQKIFFAPVISEKSGPGLNNKDKFGHTDSNNITIVGVVANRGEDLRFPISSSSGFSSPFAFYPF